jgi:hypothetical protein
MKKLEIFKNFVGDWNLDRDLGAQGFAKGAASYELQDNNNLKYREDVEITFNNVIGKHYAYREYLYFYNDKNNSIIKTFSDGKPFHALDFDLELHTASGSHFCGSDNYRALYNFKDHNKFVTSYIVRGPSKNYTICTEYTRILDQEPVLIGTYDDVITQKL